MKISIKKLNENAIIPTRDYGNAGYDLYATEDVIIAPGERRLIKTGIAMAIPIEWYGHISDRSGMAYKKGAHCLGKIIDPSYRKEIGIVLLNTDKKETLTVCKGDRPAQILFKQYGDFDFEEVEELDITDRGIGWGSSGN